jgi:hypothetical protein
MNKIGILILLVPSLALADDLPSVAITPEPPGLRLAVQAEGAYGIVTGEFRNQLVGGRLDYRFSPTVSLGGYLGYVNLRGKEGRVHSVLPLVQLEYQLARQPYRGVYFPVRFGTGYLPRNGPVARLGTGIAVELSPRLELVGQVSPMVWITHDRALLSMNVGIELAYQPGGR